MTARRTARPLVSTAVALSLGGPAVALAQEVGPYDPLGIRAGAFLIFPSLTVSEVYNDNVFAVDNNKDDDLITVIQPEVRAESNWSRHRIGLTAGSEVAFHINEEDEDYQDFFVSGDGRLDITRQNFVDAELLFARDHRDRDDPEDEGDRDELTDIYRYGGELSFTQLFNRLNFRLTGRALRTAYTESEDADEDENVYDALLRTGFFVSPRINTFIEGRYNVEQRDRSEDFNGIERDSQGWGVSGGAEVDLTNLLVGEFSVGYRRQSFEEDDFDEEDGIGYNLDLTWTPTLLTTVALSGGGDFR
ncbi:MAG TPA: outer membrane beta-barrel protein, partial [Geminicoccaceae bacterium]|nr:outer membrane beta-barrel protein [Geminicoccaceae bacterium]